MRKLKGLVIILVVMMVLIMQGNTNEAEAASKYIKVEDYIEHIVKEMKWDIDKTSKQPYIDVAMDKGILKKGDFKDYSAYLTRTDCAVIANRLDEYINLWYGYPKDVYEFLKDCTLFENKLFYTTEGSFYPEGATRNTYPEELFHEEVVMPILGEYFKDDNWKDRGLRTGYEYIRDKEGNIVKRYMEIGVVPKRIESLNIDPFDKNSDIVKAWNVITDGERQLGAVLDKRISDIKDVPKTKREAVASIVSKGIIKGYSNGMYVQNREFRGNKKITDSGAKNVIQLVLTPVKRARISPDGQLIRTTKLPKNYKDYKYILDCFPNKYYEMNYDFMYRPGFHDGTVDKSSYHYPKEIDYDFLYDSSYNYQLKLDMDKYEYYDTALLKLERYLQYLFNVDYRTVDDKWKEGLASSFSSYNVDWRLDLWLDYYIKAMKKNCVILESQLISIDPGTLYDNARNLYVRVYVKYKVTANNVNVNQDGILYGDYTTLTNLKSGEWREGVYDIEISDVYTMESIYQWGVDTMSYITDWVFEDSFK